MLGRIMNGNADVTVHSLFKKWQEEDQELESYLDGVRDWMNDVSQLGIPRFGETASRLQQLHKRLMLHFEREDELGEQLMEFYAGGSVELNATRRQAERDHQQLSDRLEELMVRLDALDPPFASWEAAMNEVEAFVVALERHEDQESESVALLLPDLKG